MVREGETTWVQCQCCGYLYQIDMKIKIDKSIINSECAKCGYERALNCGDKEDIYLYMNENFDRRYY